MILRKPYAFFIKLFKPLHLLLAAMIGYLIYLTSNILNFLNSYMQSMESVVGQTIKSKLISGDLFRIPIMLILFSMFIIAIMVRKKKPITFYVVNIFLYIAIIVITSYTSSFLGVLEKSIVSIKLIKLIHDLVLINILIESVTFTFFAVRGMGLNIKKFDFDSELLKFDIEDKDKEEFEFNIEVDLAESRRKRRERIRFLKYRYLENRLLVNSIISLVIILIIGIVTINIIRINNQNKEGNIYTLNDLSIGVDNTIILNKDFRGIELTKNYLIVVVSTMQSYNKIYLNDFSLRIGELTFKPTLKYSNNLVDIGISYDESNNIKESGKFLFTFEVPEKFIKSDMKFNYSSRGKAIKIKLNPTDIKQNNLTVLKSIGDEISFSDILGDISFKINDYEIKNKFLFEYNYCFRDNDCMASKEYVSPTINTNFDKSVLRLNVVYNDLSNLKIKDFYKFFSKFGSIYYKLEDTWVYQTSNFEELKSTKVNTKDNVYIGVNSDIAKAQSIKLVFNIRGGRYEYILKEEEQVDHE